MRRALASLLAAVLFAPVGLAQTQEEDHTGEGAEIKTIGEAIVEVPVSYVEIQLNFASAEAASLDQAIAACERFATDLEPNLRIASVQFLEVVYEAPRVTKVAPAEARLSAVVRLRLGLQGRTEEGFAELGLRMETVLQVGRNLGVEDVSVAFVPADKDVIAAQAVQTATEQAYPRAEMIAQTLGTQVAGVRSVEIIRVEWPEEVDERRATIQTALCHAKVRVVYVTLP